MTVSKLGKIFLVMICILVLFGCSKETDKQDVYIFPVSKMDAMMEITSAYVTEYMGLSEASVVLGNPLSAYRLSEGKLHTIAYEEYPVFVDGKVAAFPPAS